MAQNSFYTCVWSQCRITKRDVIDAIEYAEFLNDQDEQEMLLAFDEICENTFGEDWDFNRMELISEAFFEDYIQETIKETTVIPENIAHAIDWALLANDARMDYTTVNLHGVDFLGIA